MILIKDNHIDAVGSLNAAVRLARQKWEKRFAVEVECRSLADVREALECAVDVIMLDNMDLPTMREALRMVDKRIPVELSGNVVLSRLKELVPLGADYISVGALTHSAPALDFSLRMRMD